MEASPLLAKFPFQPRIQVGTWRWFKVVLLLPVVLARLLSAIIVLAVGRLFAMAGCIVVVRLCLRLVLFIFGFYWIEVVDRRSVPCGLATTSRVIVANHVGYFDMWAIVAYLGCGVVVAEGTLSLPLLGPCLASLGCVSVNRGTQSGRDIAKTDLLARIADEALPPLLVFAEGCTSNDEVLCLFRQGAFLPGLPVQPLFIRYPNCCVDFYHGRGGGSGLGTLLYQLSQVYNRQHITMLPVVEPTLGEPASEFAERVRNGMARAMGVSLVDYSYAGVRLCMTARRLGLTRLALTAHEAKRKLGLSVHDLEELMERFASTLQDQHTDAAPSLESYVHQRAQGRKEGVAAAKEQ